MGWGGWGWGNIKHVELKRNRMGWGGVGMGWGGVGGVGVISNMLN